MTRNQYNNVIQWTLSQCSDSSEDSLSISREIFRNLGIPFPNGDYKEVLRIMMSGVYMGWSICTMEQAAQCADQGIPAVGLSTSRIIVVMPEEAEAVVVNETGADTALGYAGLALPAGEITVDERMDMQFFAFAEIEDQNLAAAGGAVRIAGRTGGSGGAYYSSPRYVTTTDKSGVNLRSTPNGGKVCFSESTEEVKLPDKSIVIPIKVPTEYQGGYHWIKVKTYITHRDVVAGKNRLGEKYIGWIVLSYTQPVSVLAPQKNEVYSKLNEDLKGNQLAMLTNARYIHRYLRFQPSTYIWSHNAIYAMLGNMIEESTLNPNYWEKGQTNSTTAGYGLTQWTKPSKYFNWLQATNRSPKEDIDHQLARIIYEVTLTHDNPGDQVQWLPDRHEPQMSFLSFTESRLSVGVLAEYFLKCYERPEYVNTKVEQRKRLAVMCQDWIEQF